MSTLTAAGSACAVRDSDSDVDRRLGNIDVIVSSERRTALRGVLPKVWPSRGRGYAPLITNWEPLAALSRP